MSGQMTELDAVNDILASVGDSPVQSLSSGTYHEAFIIKQLLDRTSREVQSRGWWFNEEENVELQPDTGGEIRLATDVINVQVKDDNDGSIIQRGNRLYNRDTRSYQFTKTVKVDIESFLIWKDLPQIARQYITALTAVKYNSGNRGIQDIKQDLQIQARNCYAQMLSEDVEGRDVNLLENSRVYNIAFRNRRR